MVMGPIRRAQLTVEAELIVKVRFSRALGEICDEHTYGMGILAEGVPNRRTPAGPRRQRATELERGKDLLCMGGRSTRWTRDRCGCARCHRHRWGFCGFAFHSGKSAVSGASITFLKPKVSGTEYCTISFNSNGL
jgi:hypothetical protein